jgi:hypothetical protein
MAQATKVVYGHSSSRICGGAVTSPEVITCACTTGSGEPEVSNFPPIFKLTNGSVSHRKKIYRLILRTNRKPPLIFYPMNSVKRNQWKPSTVPTNRWSTLHLYFSNSKSITSTAIVEVNGRIVGYLFSTL